MKGKRERKDAVPVDYLKYTAAGYIITWSLLLVIWFHLKRYFQGNETYELGKGEHL